MALRMEIIGRGSLNEIIGNTAPDPDDAVIYLRGSSGTWNGDSDGVVYLDLADDAPADFVFERRRYFLEIELAKQAIDVWRNWNPEEPDADEYLVQAVVHYAVRDAWMPPLSEAGK